MRKTTLTDASLCEAVVEMREGLIDADDHQEDTH
jgi:hypothetical protein